MRGGRKGKRNLFTTNSNGVNIQLHRSVFPIIPNTFWWGVQNVCKIFAWCLEILWQKIIFRYCIRRDPYQAKYLDKQTEGLDETQNMETAQISANTALAPQPSLMEVDTQSRLNYLVSKDVAVSEFEKTLDGVKGTAKIYWQSSWTEKFLVLTIPLMN